MLGEERALEILKKLLSMVEVEQAEAVLLGKASGLTRFANSTIHQNVYEKDTVILLRVAKGKKIGVARSNLTDTESLKQLARRAAEIADSQVPNPNFESFAHSPKAPKVEAFFEETANCSPTRRAENVKMVIAEADKFGFLAAGSHSTTANEIAYANSLGTTQYHRQTAAYMNTVIMSPTSSGYADYSSLNIADFDARKIGEKATKICADSQNPREIEEGRYDVVISPEAVDEIMNWLSYIGFGAESFQEGRSFMSGRLGERIMGENISIWDDGLDPRGIPMPFDFEGVPKQRIAIIENGIARNVVYSILTAHKEGKQSTGHALPPGEEIAAMPINIFFGTGKHTVDEMIASLERGLIVTRFHYINGLLDTRRALFTGMTRDGTFYVENGKIKYPVKNLRFTDSMLEAFSRVEMISKEAKLQLSYWYGANVVPALKIKDFNFSGKTEF